MNQKEKKLRILVIDDEESIRDSIKWHLEDLGFTVITASQPDLCPVYDHQHCDKTNRCADVLLIDQNMPGMSGIDFIRLQVERGCKLPPRFKMVMTGALAREIETLCADLGCELEQKPLHLDKVEAFVLKAKAAIDSGELP